MLFYDVALMASRFVNNYRGKTGILSITFATREQYSQNLRDIYVMISDAQNCQRYNVEGIPQNELTQLQHPWYRSNFTIYLPNMSTQFDVNIKHCVPNIKEPCSLTDVYCVGDVVLASSTQLFSTRSLSNVSWGKVRRYIKFTGCLAFALPKPEISNRSSGLIRNSYILNKQMIIDNS
jgi:hypothetical protein